MNTIFNNEMNLISRSLASIDNDAFTSLIEYGSKTIARGGKIIATGLGKNVPICEKFVGTMVSLGLPASFMHTNSAIHGDMGIIRDGDLLILLTKSGETSESIHLYNLLKDRKIDIWLISFNEDSTLGKIINNKIILDLEHEGDLWNIVPNNSSILNLLVLQKLCISLAQEMNITLGDFKRNHPGGHIGEVLKCTN